LQQQPVAIAAAEAPRSNGAPTPIVAFQPTVAFNAIHATHPTIAFNTIHAAQLSLDQPMHQEQPPTTVTTSEGSVSTPAVASALCRLSRTLYIIYNQHLSKLFPK
jgi:hypothetical protein